MWLFIGNSFLAESGMDLVIEKVQSPEGVFLVGRRSRRGGGGVSEKKG